LQIYFEILIATLTKGFTDHRSFVVSKWGEYICGEQFSQSKIAHDLRRVEAVLRLPDLNRALVVNQPGTTQDARQLAASVCGRSQAYLMLDSDVVRTRRMFRSLLIASQLSE
jgi:hypothetical protein